MSDSKPPAAANSNLLDFEPVVRKVKWPDGWTPERQRRFIELLAETGSPHRAAAATGKVLSGIEVLYRQAGADSFRAAWDRALEIARTRERNDLAQMGDGPPVEPPHRRASVAEPDPESEVDEDGRLELIENVLRKHALKVGLERKARLNGEVVAADFYLRQITWIEVAMDLISGHGAAFRYLHDFRCGEHYLSEIAETPMSRLLDEHRREIWDGKGEPERPEHPPRRYLLDRGDYSLEPLEVLHGGEISHAEQQRAFAERHAADAKAQVAWEAQAHEAKEASEHGAAARRKLRLVPEEDFADRAMREAIAAAKRAHPEDFEEDDE
jgi:hypothetical protein